MRCSRTRRRRITAAAVVAAFASCGSVALYAQWPAYPTANVPRTRDGEPDLAAPPPRTPSGRPDFTGIWERSESHASDGPGTSDGLPLATFRDVGANLDGGIPFRPLARLLREARMANGMAGNPDAHCLPMGHMQFHLHPQPRKIVQTPAVIVILYEGNGGVRQIFTDGRPLPDEQDVLPWWYGYSVGRWEGDTLVVETIGFRDDVWLDVYGSPLTNAGKIIERFRRPSFGRMEIDVTIDDPTAYTEPFTVRVEHSFMHDTALIEFVCLENEKSSRYFD